MDYERSNAKEWDMDGDPNPGYSEHESSDEALIDYVQSHYDGDETVGEDLDSDWQQVTHKKMPSKPSANPKLPIPIKINTARASRSKLPPPKGSKISPYKEPRLPPPSLIRTQSRGSRPLLVQGLRPPQPHGHLLPLRPQPKVTFSTNRDNPAKAAFRAKKDSTGSIKLSDPCSYIEPDRKRMYEILEEMGVRLGSFIRPPQHLKDTELLLWGDATQVERTKKELQQWIRLNKAEPLTEKRADHFARSTLLTEEKGRATDRKLKRDSVRQRFQKAPDPSVKLKFTGAFLWPVDEVRPEDLLGPSFEAFDILRILHQAYITFDHRLGFFDIKSDNEDSVSDVMRRMTGTMKEYAARNRREVMVLMVEYPEPTEMHKDIKTVAAPNPGQGIGIAYMPILTGRKLSEDEKVTWEKQRQVVSKEQFLQIGGTFRKVISYLPFYRGRIQMRVLFGTFALTTFRRWPEGVESVPFEGFLKNTKISATRGRIIKDLQMKTTADVLLATIYKANKLFEPVDSLTTKLEHVKPNYAALFEFNIPGTGKVRLEVELGKPGIDGLYETTNKTWTRILDKAETVEPMEMFMLRVQGGLSWELKIATANNMDSTRITPDMTKFVQKVVPKVPAGAKPHISGQRVFTWSHSLPSMTFEQKTALRYRLINNPACIFEFARYDTYESTSNGTATTPKATYWGATFWSAEWDSVLGHNANLGIGEAASWNRTLGTFFQPNFRSSSTGPDAGLKDCMMNITSIVKLLDEMRGGKPD